MTDYNLPFNGNDIRDGLTRVVSPDVSPQSPSTKMVTSEGIKSALDDKLNASAIVTNLNSPNNTTVPSSLAVSNAFTMGGINVASKPGDFTFSGANGYYNSGWNLAGSDITTDGTTVGVTGAGLWLITFTIQCRNTHYNYYYENQFRLSGNAIYTCRPEDGFTYLTGSTFFNSSGYFDMNLYHYRYQNNAGGTIYRNPRVEFLKLK